MLKSTFFASMIAISSLLGLSTSASAVVLGNFNDTNNPEGWTRINSSGVYNSANPFGSAIYYNPAVKANAFIHSDRSYQTASLSKNFNFGSVNEIFKLTFDIASFRFDANSTYGLNRGAATLDVVFNGTSIANFNNINSNLDSSLNPLVGQTFLLTSLGNNNSLSYNYSGTGGSVFEIDNIEANSIPTVQNNQQVPEPAEWLGLLVTGTALVVMKRKYSKKLTSNL